MFRRSMFWRDGTAFVMMRWASDTRRLRHRSSARRCRRLPAAHAPRSACRLADPGCGLSSRHGGGRKERPKGAAERSGREEWPGRATEVAARRRVGDRGCRARCQRAHRLPLSNRRGPGSARAICLAPQQSTPRGLVAVGRKPCLLCRRECRHFVAHTVLG